MELLLAASEAGARMSTTTLDWTSRPRRRRQRGTNLLPGAGASAKAETTRSSFIVTDSDPTTFYNKKLYRYNRNQRHARRPRRRRPALMLPGRLPSSVFSRAICTKRRRLSGRPRLRLCAPCTAASFSGRRGSSPWMRGRCRSRCRTRGRRAARGCRCGSRAARRGAGCGG